MKIVLTEDSPKPIGAYSQGIFCDGGSEKMLFTSGQIGIDLKTGELAPGFREQCVLALQSVKAILGKEGFSLSDVCKATVFITDFANYRELNEVFTQFFEGKFPARSVVQVVALPKGALLEIEAIACRE
jgi:2-iminobutanoate/2-iminopropanoate deaminase